MIIDEELMTEILDKLDDSTDKSVAQQKFKDWAEMQSYLDAQYESRLGSILKAKSSSIERLTPEIKAKIKIRKQRLFGHLKQAFEKKE